MGRDGHTSSKSYANWAEAEAAMTKRMARNRAELQEVDTVMDSGRGGYGSASTKSLAGTASNKEAALLECCQHANSIRLDDDYLKIVAKEYCEYVERPATEVEQKRKRETSDALEQAFTQLDGYRKQFSGACKQFSMGAEARCGRCDSTIRIGTHTLASVSEGICPACDKGDSFRRDDRLDATPPVTTTLRTRFVARRTLFGAQDEKNFVSLKAAVDTARAAHAPVMVKSNAVRVLVFEDACSGHF